MARMAATRPGSRLAARVLPPLDRWSFRASGGKVALTESIGGLPTVMLTTRGARSGLERTVPLLAVPSGDDLAVLGTNWGGGSSPAWVHNLAASPVAVVEHGENKVEVRAERLDGASAEEVWRRAIELYPGYAEYPRRAGTRVITVWQLVPVG
jgi:deazaflavin-dependent oxidoreductase (nitroreductase family)